jgi:hypothetical protein
VALPTTAWLQANFAPIYALIDSVGTTVIIRENTAPGAWSDHGPIKAKINPVKMEDLIQGSSVKQGDMFVIVKADSFPVARQLEQKDRIRIDGRDYSVINDDRHQHRIGDKTYARVIHVRG